MPLSLYAKLTKHLNDERFVRFLENVVAEGDRPRSTRHMLDRIMELGSVLAALDEAEQDAEHLTTVLAITPRGKNTFRIRFGEHGDTVGDGGDWTVLYFTNGQVRRVTSHSFWMG